MHVNPTLRQIAAGMLAVFFVSGCTPQVESSNSSIHDVETTLDYLLTEVASQPTSPPRSTTQPTYEAVSQPEDIQIGVPGDEDSAVPAAEAVNYFGSVIVVRLDRAACSYRPNVNGEPTFCNDQPYPNHNFTLLVWGQDWSFLDGKCLLVEGEVIEYEGIAEIVASDLSQISFCGE